MKGKVPIDRIVLEFGMSFDSVKAKIRRLGLEEEDPKNLSMSSSSCELPKELFSVEQALMMLAKAMKVLEYGGLDKNEILRLRSLVQACRIYQDKFGEYVDYRTLEEVFKLLVRIKGFPRGYIGHWLLNLAKDGSIDGVYTARYGLQIDALKKPSGFVEIQILERKTRIPWLSVIP